jgi:hypothetical protein
MIRKKKKYLFELLRVPSLRMYVLFIFKNSCETGELTGRAGEWTKYKQFSSSSETKRLI